MEIIQLETKKLHLKSKIYMFVIEKGILDLKISRIIISNQITFTVSHVELLVEDYSGKESEPTDERSKG